MPPLTGELTESRSLALAKACATMQTVGGVTLGLGVLPRLTCLGLGTVMAVACHWQLVTRKRPIEDMFALDCDGHGLGPGYFALGYAAVLTIGAGRLRPFRFFTPPLG